QRRLAHVRTTNNGDAGYAAFWIFRTRSWEGFYHCVEKVASTRSVFRGYGKHVAHTKLIEFCSQRCLVRGIGLVGSDEDGFIRCPQDVGKVFIKACQSVANVYDKYDSR